MIRKVVLLNGHPNPDSFNQSLVTAFKIKARTQGLFVDEILLHTLAFNPNMHSYSRIPDLEPDLVLAQKKISEAEHLVIFHPLWWGTMPALLKGFLDRVLLPGFAFKYRENSVLWDKLLQGKSASLIITMDYPTWYYRWVMGAPLIKIWKKHILGFCGIQLTQHILLGPIRKSTPQKREHFINKVEDLVEKIVRMN